MKTPNISEPLLQRFVETMNAHEVEPFVGCFAEDAVVEDEGKTHRGRTEIRAWISKAFAEYQPVLEVRETSIQAAEGQGVISGEVSGTFDGSPVILHYHLRFNEQGITWLKCTV